MENEVDKQSTSKKAGKWFAGYIVAGLIFAIAKQTNFTKTLGGELTVAVVAIGAGFFYHRLKEKIKIKNNVARFIVTFIILEMIAGALVGLLIPFANLFLVSTGVQDPTAISATNQSNQSVENWQTFNSAKYNFNVDLPIKPTTTEDAKSNTTRYSSEANNSNKGFSIDVADLGQKPSDFDNKTVLEGSINALLSSKDKGSHSSFTKFRDYDAESFSYSDSKNNYYGKGVAFIRDGLTTGKIFILTELSSDSSFPDYDRFINSFEFKSK